LLTTKPLGFILWDMERKRVFVDAPDWLRCRATVTLRDKTTAQCGRCYSREYARNVAVNDHLCTQHAEMKLAGKTIRHWE
jgi:hypothetical protein